MKFEWDEEKNKKNQAKHKISFEEAMALWQDENAIEVPAQTVDGEERLALIADLEGKIWAAFYTMRKEVIRIFSVRRARKKEVKFYEQAKIND